MQESQHPSMGRLDAAAVESAASVLGVGPPDVTRLPLTGIGSSSHENAAQESPRQQAPEAENAASNGFIPCTLTYQDKGKSEPINLVMKPAAVKDGIRSRNCGVVYGKISGKELHEFVSQHWEHYAVGSCGEKGSVAIIMAPGNKRVKMIKDLKQGIVSDALGELRKVLTSTGEIWTTVRLPAHAAKQKVTRDDIIRNLRSYLTLNPVEFRAEVWAMKLKTATDITKGESLILGNVTMAMSLRQDIINLEGAKCYVKFLAETKVLDIEKAINLPKVCRLTRQDDGTITKESMPYLAAIAMFLEEYCFICCGDSDQGKSALARATCKLYCEANGTPYYIETNTPDSLRQVSVNGFFRRNVPVILDEWKPEGNKYTGKDGIDMLKCLCTVDDEGATIKCRYSDIKFAPQMPKLMTCNCTLQEWLDGLGEVTTADLKAVLKRCLFVETTESVIPQELRKDFVGKRRKDCRDKMQEAMKKRGVKVPNFLEAAWKPELA